MTSIGTIESLWRYPVKSMAGEKLTEAFLGFSGVYGDRCYAIKNSAARKGFPYLNATAQPQMLLYHPKFRYPERAMKPPNLIEAMSIGPGATPANAEPEDLLLDVVTPSGAIMSIDDPALFEMLCAGLRGENHLTLVRSDRALTDCRPVSLISLQTIQQIEEELRTPMSHRRFRANIYLNLDLQKGFAEDEFVGRRLRVGTKAEIAVLQRDPRCNMISLDPETGGQNTAILRTVAQAHEANAGVYCAVLVEGIVKSGDTIELVE